QLVRDAAAPRQGLTKRVRQGSLSRAEPEPAAPAGDHVPRRGYSLRLMHLAPSPTLIAERGRHPAARRANNRLMRAVPRLWQYRGHSTEPVDMRLATHGHQLIGPFGHA